MPRGEDSSRIEEREKKKKQGSISTVRSSVSQSNLLEKIENAEQEVARKVTQTVS